MRLRTISLLSVCAIAVSAFAGTAPAGAASTVQRAEAAGTVIVTEGDIRIVSSMNDGQLVQELVDASGDEPIGLDAANTVLSLPNAETDLASGSTSSSDQKSEALSWPALAPGLDRAWRTLPGAANTKGPAANPISLSVDASAIPADDLVAGTVYTQLEGASSDEGGFASIYKNAKGQWSGSTHEGAEVSSPLAVTGGATKNLGLLVSAQGRTCVTLAAGAQLTSDRSVAQSAITLTVVAGATDPASVVPCEQPDPIASAAASITDADADAPVVLDEGDVRLSTRLTDDALVFDLVSVAWGSGMRYDVSDVVLSVPEQDTAYPETSSTAQSWSLVAEAGTLMWRTLGTHYRSNLTVEQHNPLLLRLDSSLIDPAAVDGRVAYTLETATTPADGYFASYETSSRGAIWADSAAMWDTREGADSGALEVEEATRTAGTFAPFDGFAEESSGSGLRTLGTAFTAPGVYCLTVGASATRASDQTIVTDRQTLTFAVGIDPAGVEPCAQSDGDGQDDEGDDGDEDRDQTVTWLETGHVDLGLRMVDGQTRFYTGDKDRADVGLIDLADAVWVARNRYTQFTVPEPTQSEDLTFIGEPGTSYYGFLQNGGRQNVALWPGISALNVSRSDFPTRDATWKVTGVSGPGDVVAWDSTKTLFSTKDGLPGEFTLGGSHVHMNWAFTEPGVYCISTEVAIRVQDDDDQLAQGQLTVAVGDIDLSQVQPCERGDEEAPVAETSPVSLEQTDQPTIVDTTSDGQYELLGYAAADGYDIAARVKDSLAGEVRYLDPENIVFSSSKHATGGWSEGANRATLSQTRLTASDAAGDIGLTLGEVDGPGDYYATGLTWQNANTPYLDTRAGQELGSTSLWTGYAHDIWGNFTAAGVYCVPFTWSGTTASGEDWSVTKTLTYAVGSSDPASDEYVDRAAVKPCADGGEGTQPQDPEDPEEDADHTDEPDSDALVLDAGHVDVASVVQNGKLATKVKDDTTSSDDLVLRETTDVVFFVAPGAETTVPSGVDFLGEAGDRVWILPETQDETLLWPGWSTELIERGLVPDGVDWKLTDVSGPGEFALFESGEFGQQIVRFNTRDGITEDDAFHLDEGVHAHGNWAFSAEGTYCLAFDRTGSVDGERQTVSSVVAIAVGDVDPQKVDPADCFSDAGQTPRPTPDDSTPDPGTSPEATATPSSDPQQTAPTPSATTDPQTPGTDGPTPAPIEPDGQSTESPDPSSAPDPTGPDEQGAGPDEEPTTSPDVPDEPAGQEPGDADDADPDPSSAPDPDGSAAPDGAAPGTLDPTGSETTGPLLIGAVVVALAGAFSLIIARRRARDRRADGSRHPMQRPR